MAHIDTLEIRDWDEYSIDVGDGFMDSSKYSTPETESDKRKQLQTQHSQIRDFINTILVNKINDLDDGEGQITQNYALKSQSGNTLLLSYSATNNNRITISLYAVDNTLLDTKIIDLNLGKMLNGITYDSTNKRLVVSYVRNGETGTEYVPLSAILNGYATEEWVLGKSYETISNVDAVRARVTSLEVFKNTTVPETYETIAASNIIRARLASLETNIPIVYETIADSNVIRTRLSGLESSIPNVYETKADANAHKSNASIHITSDERNAWNDKQPMLEAGAFIIIETLPNGHQRISAASGEISVDYRNTTNKPYINNVELVGNKSFMDLGLPIYVDSNGNICMEE